MAASVARVLVVEDEMLSAMLLESMVGALGYAVIGPVARIPQALEMVEAEAPDAVILDVNLGGRHAFPVARALGARGIPFAFVTGYSRDQLPAAWRSQPLLQKPFTQARLGHVLADLLAAGSAAATR